MAGLTSKALAFGDPVNKEKTFQGQRFDDELGLNWVQFKWRNHDEQTGRFIEIDPLASEYPFNSTYAFSENKVTNHIELEELEAVSAGMPQGYIMEGFRQLFQAAGNLISFKAEAHINKEVEVKTEVKTPGGSIENKSTTTVVESKIELKTNFGEYFKNGGGKMVEFSAGTNTVSRVENTTTAIINTPGAPIRLSTKTSLDAKGRDQTTLIGTGISIPLGDKGKVSISAGGFSSQLQSGGNGIQNSFGFKAAFDATLINKSVTNVNTPTVKITTNTQTSLGASVTQSIKLPWQW